MERGVAIGSNDVDGGGDLRRLSRPETQNRKLLQDDSKTLIPSIKRIMSSSARLQYVQL